ncbi:MAG: hypothetical protein ABGX10_15170 [Paracoccus sp. (in: a-proteobacteria)]|uniref:hypothetical protein n=1 Tax=Paracoccus sp. TaxID=267 RepID=UPI003242336A
MARIYDITSYLPSKSCFAPEPIDAEPSDIEAFDAGAFDTSRETLFGARARMAALLASKGQDELRRDYEENLPALADALEALFALGDECKAIQKIADAATARLIMAGQKICADA